MNKQSRTPRGAALALVAVPLLAALVSPTASAGVDPIWIVFDPGQVDPRPLPGSEGTCALAQAVSPFTGCLVASVDDGSGCLGAAAECDGRPRTTSAWATIYFHRTTAGCVASWETGVRATGAGARYDYTHGAQQPLVDQRGAFGRAGPFTDVHAGTLVMPRGMTLAVQAWIVKDSSDSSNTGLVRFTC